MKGNMNNVVKLYLVVLLFGVCIFLFPATFIIWWVLNRNVVNPWIAGVVFIFPLVASYQFYKIFSGIVEVRWYEPMKNPFLIFGAIFALFFIISRFISISPRFNLKKMESKTRVTAIAQHIVFLLFLLSPVVVIQNLIPNTRCMAEIYSIEILIPLWTALIIYMLFKYSKDELATLLNNYAIKYKSN